MIFSCLKKSLDLSYSGEFFETWFPFFAPRLCKRSSCVWSYLKSYGSQWGRDTWKLCFSQFSITETSTQIQMHLFHPFSQLFENCSITQIMSFHAPNFLFAVKVHPRKAGKDRSSQLYFMVQPDDLTWQSTVVSFSRDGHEWVCPWKQVEHFENNSVDWIDTCYKRRGEQPGWYQTIKHLCMNSFYLGIASSPAW